MQGADWIVLIAYLIATVAIGVILGRKVKNTADLFAAGGASPWWASRLSAPVRGFAVPRYSPNAGPLHDAVEARPTAGADYSPARIVAWSMVALGAGMACLLPINPG